MTFLRRIIPLAAILVVATALIGQGTAVSVVGTGSDEVAIAAADSLNLPGSIAAGTSLDSNGDLTVSGTITAGGDIEGNNLTGTNTGNVTIASGAAQDIFVIGGTGGQVLDLKTFPANTVLAGPISGAAAKPTPRALVADDIPATLNGTHFSGVTTFGDAVSAYDGAVSVNAITANDGTIEVTGGIDTTGPLFVGNGTPASITVNGPVSATIRVVTSADIANAVTGACVVLGAETVTLPEAAAGLHLYIVADNASSTIVPASGDTLSIAGAIGGSTTGREATPSVVPSGIQFIAIDSTKWVAVGDYPTWSLEPLD